MRKNFLVSLIILLSFLMINSGFAQINQTWKWMHPKPQGNTLRWVKMFSTTNWVAVGYSGTFMSTTNAGSTWTHYTNAGGTQSYGSSRSLYNGWFFNMSTGLVCGSSGWIGRTTNGGAAWDSIASGVTSTLYGMHFVNSTTGFIGGSSGTVLKSTNAGATWTALTSGTTSSLYNIFAVDANHIYVCSTSGNIRISTNGGANWTQYSTGASTLYDVNFLNANTGFVTGSSGHVRRTTNGGSSWTAVNPPNTSIKYGITTVVGGLVPSTPYFEGFESTTFPPTGWRAVNVLGTQVWHRTTAQHHTGVASAFINYDCGANGGLDWLITPQWSIMAGDSLAFWMRLNDIGFQPDSLCVRVSTTDTALSSFTNRILYIREGAGYPPTNTSWYRYAVSLNAFAGQNIYVGFKHANNCGDGIYLDDIAVNRLSPSYDVYITGDAFNIYKTTNLGANWIAMNHLDPGQNWTSTFYSMDVSGTSMTAVGTYGMFNRSTNSGANWTSFHTWLNTGTFYDVWVEFNDRKVWCVGSNSGTSGDYTTQILYSSNGGTTWVDQTILSTRYYRAIYMVNPSTGYIAGSSGSVRKTTNGGTNWDSLPFPSTALLYDADFPNASTGWVVGTSSPYIWKTVNGGTNWASQTGPTTSVYGIDMINANTGWFVGSSGSLRKTTDGGATWVVQTPGYTSTLYGIKMLNANTGFLCGGGGTVRRTTNGGTNWDTLLTPYNTTLYATDWWSTDPNYGFVVGSSGYTARTTNGGQAWSIENTSGSTMYGIYMRHGDSAWAVGSSCYAFKWAHGLVGITSWQSEIPKTYFLSQNYPNPFNPVTTIKFGLPKAGSVTLNVYDITGRLVTTILNNAPLNAGTVTHKFDGSNFASGVYFYSLIVDNIKIDTKKMVLVK